METHLDIARAAAAALRGEAAMAALLVAGAVALVWVDRRWGAAPFRQRRTARAVLLLVGALVGLAVAWQMAWLGDDAHISFRYARNFAEGHGLVYNPGEWVEGYTNLLWTVALGLAGRAGLSIEHAALFGNLAAFVGTVGAAAAVTRRAGPTAGLVPFAALALAGTRPFTTYATSGLETMPTALLVAVALWASTLGRHGPWLAGLALALAVLSRLDQALLVVGMGLALAGEDLVHGDHPRLLRRLDPSRLAAFAAPSLVLLPLSIAWRVATYGDPFPNTYYAKSAAEPYWSQGLVYLFEFLATTGGAVWLPLGVVALWGRPRHRDETRLRLMALASVPLVGLYVVRVGGDFMEHRFFVPLLPVVAVAIEVSVRWRLTEISGWPARLMAAASALALASALLPIRVIEARRARWYLADEATYYPVDRVFPIHVDVIYSEDGVRLREVFTDRGLNPRLAGDSIGIVGYHSRLPLIDNLGLLNRNIARRPLRHRSRPGHEKLATVDELIAEGAVISVSNLRPPQFGPPTRAVVDEFSFHLLRWDQSLVASLARTPGARLPNPTQHVAQVLAVPGRTAVLDARSLYTSFLGDHPAKDQLLDRLDRRLQSVDDFESWQDRPLLTPGFVLADASSVSGASGDHMLSSFGPKKTRKGRYSIDLGTVARDELRLAVGGRGAVRVEVEVAGAVVATFKPSTKAPVQVSVDLSAHRGQPALLRVVDDDANLGGGIVVDAVRWAGGPDDIRTLLRAQPNSITLLPAAEEELPPDDPYLTALYARATRWGFEKGPPEGTQLEGSAFGGGSAGTLPNQQPIVGQQGARLLNSYHGGDGATGRVVLPEFLLSEEPILLRVGGGDDCQSTWVGLVVGGKVVARACGSDDEVLRRKALAAPGRAGEAARLMVVDDSSKAWGHLLVDDVLFLEPDAHAGMSSVP